MKGEWQETEVMAKRELKIGELLITTLEVGKKQIRSWLLLLVMAYLPEAIGMQYRMAKLVPTDDVTQFAEELMPVIVWSAVLSFLSMIGPLVVAVLLWEEFYGTEKVTFPKALNRGMRRWIPAALTHALLIAWLGIGSIMIGMAAEIIPSLFFLFMPFLILFYLYVSLMLTDTAAMASLRGLTAWHALRYIRSLFRERLPRVLGVYAGLWLIGTLPSQLIQLLASELLANVEATWVSVVVMTVLQTILGIFTLYTAAAAVLMLLNYEAMRQREWKENQEQAR